MLNLNFNNIGSKGAKGLVLPQGLQTLYLSNNKIDAKKERISSTFRLQTLCIDINNIGDEGAKGLVLPWGLKKLDISDNYISKKGAQELALPLGLKTIVLDCMFSTYGIVGFENECLMKGKENFKLTKRFRTKLKMEFWRGVLYGNPDDSFIQGLKDFLTIEAAGSKNIRRLIMDMLVV